MTVRPWFDRIAHDLRGPLTSLQTAAWLLRNDPQGTNAKELADIVVRQGERLGRMIEELDDWSRAEQQRLMDQPARIALAPLIDLALTGVSGCTIEPEFQPGADTAMVLGDDARLTQLLRSLIAQTVARDPKARLRVASEEGLVRISLLDHGPSLDEVQCERLLNASQHPAPDEGLGLRLLIARAIAEAHGGTLEARCTEEGGLELRCTLPLA